jgi:hypothetical protein
VLAVLAARQSIDYGLPQKPAPSVEVSVEARALEHAHLREHEAPGCGACCGSVRNQSLQRQAKKLTVKENAASADFFWLAVAAKSLWGTHR